MDWHEEVQARREQRAMRRAERAENDSKRLNRAIVKATRAIAVMGLVYAWALFGLA